MASSKLSKQLTLEFGKGFDVRNLRNMRSFYVVYPNRNAVRTELSWTHYRTLLRVENPKARAWYQQEAIEAQENINVMESEPQLRPKDVLRGLLCFATSPDQSMRGINRV